MSEEIRGLVLGALLHDIGKFKQRASLGEDEGKTHIDIGHSWLVSQYGEGLISAGARNHHAKVGETWDSNLSMIFYEADNCAASERKPYDPAVDIRKSWHRQMRLGNVFARVRDPGKDYGPEDDDSRFFPDGSYWPLKPLGGWIEPDQDAQGRNTAEDYRRLWHEFEEEFHAIKAVDNHRNLDVMLHLLEKYTAFIPSITLKIYADGDQETYAKHPDVSLFDHLKLTAAVAACLYHFHRVVHHDRWERRELLKDQITSDATWDENWSKPEFLLIGGDLSGVQRFIYTISSKGALKSLKGRSFFLELLTEHVVDRLLEELALTRCNVIFTGGGHFYLIGPNAEETKQAISRVEEEINDYLLEAFGGTLWQAIEVVEFGKYSFKDPFTVWQTLSGSLEQAKRKKWYDQLCSLLEVPREPHPDCYTKGCVVCGREDTQLPQQIGDESACCHCWEQFKLGESLRKAVAKSEHPVIYRWEERPPGEAGERSIRIGDRYYQPVPGELGRQRDEVVARASAVYHLNEWDVSCLDHPKSRPLMVGTYLLKGTGDDPPDLEESVAGGFGMERLGVLRMDVDRLGKVFTAAVRKSERTFSRMASLSRNLSLFFKYHLNQVLDVGAGQGYETLLRADVADRGNGSGPPARRLAVVYSGGDDLFLIGHWLDVTEAAFDIHNAFARFTGNQFITVSAGIVTAYPHEPVYRLAAAAGDAEKAAKESGRDSVTLLSTKTGKWTEAEKVADVVRLYGDLLEADGDRLIIPQGSFSRGFLYRVLGLVRDLCEKGVIVLPKLAYLLGRGGPSKEFLNVSESRRAAWRKFTQDYLAASPARGEKNHYVAVETATLWTLMLMRKGDQSSLSK